MNLSAWHHNHYQQFYHDYEFLLQSEYFLTELEKYVHIRIPAKTLKKQQN